MPINKTIITILIVLGFVLTPHAHAETKVWLCTGDYGMWAQDRAEMIQRTVNENAPGKFSFEVDQSFNFVKKLEAPNFAERFDVIVIGDVAMGQMTTRSQEALIRYVNNGGGLIYSMNSKSTIPFAGPRSVEPMPLYKMLPLNAELSKRLGVSDTPHADITVFLHTDPFLQGLDFSNTPLLNARKEGAEVSPLILERLVGDNKGYVMTLYGAMEATYRYVAYAKHERQPHGWDEWRDFGKFWVRLLDRAATSSPIRGQTRATVDSKVQEVGCSINVTVDSSKVIDDIRSAVFSVVALQQLYNEDGGAGEGDFLALNPRDWHDRRTQEVMKNTVGRYPDKTVLFREYNIKGIMMGNNSYGSYGSWNEETWNKELASIIDSAKEYPSILTYLQAGNEPPLNQGFFDFYNRFVGSILKEVPQVKAMGPGCAWNAEGPPEKEFKEFIDHCGKNLDVLNWHIYTRPPSSVRDQVLYWTEYAQGKLRTDAPVTVSFTESDTWNTRDSQFNYLVERAFVFLPMPEIVSCFQYCMRPRYEGGTYHFGVLMANTGRPEFDEFTANYNGYWIFRNLRGKMLETQSAVSPTGASEHCRTIASVSPDGKTVTVIAYYDTGFYDGASKSSKANINVSVKLPDGDYVLETSTSNWKDRNVQVAEGAVKGTVTVAAELLPCHAVAWTWTRKD